MTGGAQTEIIIDLKSNLAPPGGGFGPDDSGCASTSCVRTRYMALLLPWLLAAGTTVAPPAGSSFAKFASGVRALSLVAAYAAAPKSPVSDKS